jgi:hypothetical protein
MIYAAEAQRSCLLSATASLGDQPCHRRRPWDELLLPTNLLNSEVAEKQIR